MTDLVRKGALAADRMSRDAEVAVACDDLARLADYDSMSGLAEIIRERRERLESGHTAELHDTQYADGSLVSLAASELDDLARLRAAEVDDLDLERRCLIWAGALIASELDRLSREARS